MVWCNISIVMHVDVGILTCVTISFLTRVRAGEIWIMIYIDRLLWILIENEWVEAKRTLE